MKDPAALLYIDKWLVSTKGMKASARGWYLNLILHQYDKGSLPNNIEDLADFADVKHSEFEEFKQVFEQVLKQKFVENSEGRLINEFAQEIIIKRESFKDKRSESGKWSYILKYIRKNHLNNKDFELFLKDNIDLNIDIKNEQVLEQVFKQNYELYINENEDKDIITNSSNNTIGENSKNKNNLFTFSEIITELKLEGTQKNLILAQYKTDSNNINKYIDFFAVQYAPETETETFSLNEKRIHFKNFLKNNWGKLSQIQVQTQQSFSLSEETKQKLSAIYIASGASKLLEKYITTRNIDEVQGINDFERAKKQNVDYMNLQLRVNGNEKIYNY